MSHAQSVRSESGFTLVELLIALALMAIFALLAYRGLDSILRLSAAGQSHDEGVQARSRTLAQLEADLRQAQSVVWIPGELGGQISLTRRSLNEVGSVNKLAVVWSYSAGSISRSVDAAPAVALLKQVSEWSWWSHQITDTPQNEPWLPLQASAVGGTASLALNRGLLLKFNHQNQPFQKAFLIGK